MDVIAIIPARSGSKGIKGKNIVSVGGKPLLAWSIEQALQTPYISRVFVSTDASEIAEVARQYKAEVIQRPAEISGDTASSESALAHALDSLKVNVNLTPDLVVFLQATSPMREADDIQKAIEMLERQRADSLFSACRVEGFVWRVQKDGTPGSFTYDHRIRPRRQDAPEDLIENGSIYLFKPWVLRQFNNRLGGKIAVYRMAALNSFQIDEPPDLELIEALMAHRAASLSASDPATVISALRRIRLLVLDFDGVVTDNRVLVTEDGKEAVLCSREDGLGLELLRKGGRVEIVVISKERNPVVSTRCNKLGIECIQGCDTKLTALQALCSARNLSALEVAYVGNDLNDVECMHWVGLPIAVADAVPGAKAAARWVTVKAGGRGAVREVCDALGDTRAEVPSSPECADRYDQNRQATKPPLLP